MTNSASGPMHPMSGAAGPTGSGMHNIQQRLDAMNLQRGQPMRDTRNRDDSPQVIDVSKKMRKVSNESLDAATHCEGWVIRKSEAAKGEKSTWSRATRKRMAITSDELLKQIKEQRKSNSVMDAFDALSQNQQGQVEDLVEYKRSSEQDPNAEWVLASIKTKKQATSAFSGPILTVRVYVILQRHIRPTSRHTSIPQGKHQASQSGDLGQNRPPRQGQDDPRPHPTGPSMQTTRDPGMNPAIMEAMMQRRHPEGIPPNMREAAMHQQLREQAMQQPREPGMNPAIREAMMQQRSPEGMPPNMRQAAVQQQLRDHAMQQLSAEGLVPNMREASVQQQLRDQAMHQPREPVIQLPNGDGQQMRDHGIQQQMHAAMREGGMPAQQPQLRSGPQGAPPHGVHNMMHGGLGLGAETGPSQGPRPGPGPAHGPPNGYGHGPERPQQGGHPQPPPPPPPAAPMFANQPRATPHPSNQRSPSPPYVVQVPDRPDPRTSGKPLRHKASRHSTDPGEILSGWADHSSGSEEGSSVFTDYDSDSTRPTSHNGSDIKPLSRHRRKSSHNQVRPGAGRRHSVRDTSFRDHREQRDRRERREDRDYRENREPREPREHREHREHRRRGSLLRRHSRDDDEISDEVDLRSRQTPRRRSSVYESDHRFPGRLEETRLIDPRRRPLADSDFDLSPRSRAFPELGVHDDLEDRVRSRLRQEETLRLEEAAIRRREEARREDALIRDAMQREEMAQREEETLRIKDRLRREDAAIRAADSMRRDNGLRREGSFHREDGYRSRLFRTSTEPTLSRGYSPPMSRGSSRYY